MIAEQITVVAAMTASPCKDSLKWTRRTTFMMSDQDVEMSRTPHAVVIIDEDESFRCALTSAIRACGVRAVHCGGSVSDAERLLRESVDVVFYGLSLGQDACALVIDRCFELTLVPVIIAVGDSADTDAIFGAAKSGAHMFCERSFSADDIERCLQTATGLWTSIQDVLPHHIGRMRLKDAQRIVRRALFEKAWRASGGNKRRAAAILGVSRRAVQLMAMDYL